MIKNYSLTVLLFTTVFFSYAQETEEDPFAEYSYLWEDTKKDKKKKKKKDTEQSVQNSVSADTIPDNNIVQTPVDSTQQVNVLSDSTQLANQPGDSTMNLEPEAMQPVITADTTITDEQVIDEPAEVPSDSGLSAEELAAIEQEKYLQDSLKKAQREAKRAERLAKQEGKEPAEDFRAGLPSMNSGSSISGGFTLTSIDGKYYAGLVLAPELSLGKVGFGLDVPILYGLEDQSIRTEIFEDGVGVLRLIRYVRYGRQKMDPVYVRVGSLTNTMIGFGGLVNNYGNSISFEKRKIGIHYDFNYKGLAGLEGLYSDFDPSGLNLLVVRPYVRPLSWTGIPIIRSLEIGTTYLTDKDQTALFGTGEDVETYKFTEPGVSAIGVDAGMTLLRVPFIQIDLFANFSKLNVASDALRDSVQAAVAANEIMDNGDFRNGSGASAGFNFRFHFIADVLSTDVRIERLSYTKNYLPQFFDNYYELNKDRKIFSLASAQKMQGIYGSLTGHVLKKLSLGGSLMIPDEITVESPAVVTLNADVEKLADKLSIHGRYFKGGLTDLEDAFKLDDRSLATIRFAYHLNRFIVTGVDYTWAFTNTDDGFETTQYVSPFFGLNIQF